MAVVYKHRIYCVTESGWAYLWKEDQELLTTCPNDAAHEVRNGSSSVVEEVNTGIVYPHKECTMCTGGNSGVSCPVIDAPAGGSGSVDQTWPYNIAIDFARFAVSAECVGCSLTVDIAPRTMVGILTADALIGTTVLHVSPTVTAAVMVGYVVALQEGATYQELGRVTAKDAGAGTITAQNATASDFHNMAQVQMTVRPAENLVFNVPGYLTFGDGRFDAMAVPAGTHFVGTLVNPTGSDARLVTYIQHSY